MTDTDLAALIESRLTPFLGKLFIEEWKAEDHDCLRTGEPVASVVIDNMVEIYPFTTTVKVGIAKREVEVQKWAVDLLVDESDLSVGMYGSAPVEVSDHRSPYEAIIEVGKVLLEYRVQSAMEEKDE
jgi:hypothetical protein